MLALEIALRDFDFNAGDKDFVPRLSCIHVAAAFLVITKLLAADVFVFVCLRAARSSCGAPPELQNGIIRLFPVLEIQRALPYRLNIHQAFGHPYIVDQAAACGPIFNRHFCCGEPSAHRIDFDASDGGRGPIK